MIEKSLKILSNKSVTSDTFLLRLSAPEIADMATPGQFLMVKVDDSTDPLLRRPFSICDATEDGVIKILYRVIGRGTKSLSNKKEGENISVLGPLGSGFRIPDPPHKIILVAGGIGIAPLLFLYKKTSSADVAFMAGFRTSNEIIDPNTIENNIKAEIATDDGSMGYNGRVTNLLEENLRQDTQNNFSIYSCGPHPMLKAVAEIAHKYNVPCQVSMETFMACGLGVCQGCIVKTNQQKTHAPYQHVCKEGPVFESNKIDWKTNE